MSSLVYLQVRVTEDVAADAEVLGGGEEREGPGGGAGQEGPPVQATGYNQQGYLKKFKGTVTPDFLVSFLACMKRSELK